MIGGCSRNQARKMFFLFFYFPCVPFITKYLCAIESCKILFIYIRIKCTVSSHVILLTSAPRTNKNKIANKYSLKSLCKMFYFLSVSIKNEMYLSMKWPLFLVWALHFKLETFPWWSDQPISNIWQLFQAWNKSFEL